MVKGVTAKMSLSLSGHTLVMESVKLSPRVNPFKEENDFINLTELRRLHHQGVARD